MGAFFRRSGKIFALTILNLMRLDLSIPKRGSHWTGLARGKDLCPSMSENLSASASADTPSAPAAPRKKSKAFWTKQFYLWHWVSSALCLGAMLFFAFTGITLNHAADIPAKPQVSERKTTLPPEFLKTIAPDGAGEHKKPLPAGLPDWLSRELRQRIGGASLADWSEFEIYLSLPRPGGDAWLTIDRESGAVHYELTRRGAISWLNDLHKGRHTGKVWAWFLDIFSVSCVVFCLTGLVLLQVHARRRPGTWPVVAAGLALPVLIILFFLH